MEITQRNLVRYQGAGILTERSLSGQGWQVKEKASLRSGSGEPDYCLVKERDRIIGREAEVSSFRKELFSSLIFLRKHQYEHR